MSLYSQSLLSTTNDKKTVTARQGDRAQLLTLLSQDLDFHGLQSGYASHNLHPFPAKFPPQLPRKFIQSLTQRGDVVLDPMMGSGTTIVEALLNNRRGIGFDIDPLAALLCRVKTNSLDIEESVRQSQQILHQAAHALKYKRKELTHALQNRWSKQTKRFVNYWFAQETQLALLALISEIENLDNIKLKLFLRLVFSSIIITKSGGVSMAFDLAHTRPHRAKIVYSQTGELLIGHNRINNLSARDKFLTKALRSPITEFEKRLHQSLKEIQQLEHCGEFEPQISFGNAQNVALHDQSVDLIVTSPPYAANAIDYMRAHKFSLVWLGYPIDQLGQKRSEYIGGEATSGFAYEDVPDYVATLVTSVKNVDEKKGRVLHRYYSEMTRALREMYRVLKPGKTAIVVVGNSTMRGQDTKTDVCLAEIGKSLGFEVPKIGVRNLDRNRRMMPVGSEINTDSQIQQRMHEEYVIGFYKPIA